MTLSANCKLCVYIKMSAKTRPDISINSRSTSNEEDESGTMSVHFVPQTIEVTADSVLIKKERLGENKYGDIFKGERVSMYSE